MKKAVERKIADLRKKIDQIDREIVISLNKRAEVVHKIRMLKEEADLSLFDPKREEEIYKKLTSYNKGPLFQENIQEIYEKILHTMKSFE